MKKKKTVVKDILTFFNRQNFSNVNWNIGAIFKLMIFLLISTEYLIINRKDREKEFPSLMYRKTI